jgi:hypothetical protein
VVLAALSACVPKTVPPPPVTAMTVVELQQVVARGPFPDDACQEAWFLAVADTKKAATRLDVLTQQDSACASSTAKVRLVQLARADTLSWAAESRAPDVATRLELARFAATSKWEPGTSAVADLVLDPDENVRVLAVTAVRALRQTIAVGPLERSLANKPPRGDEERALLCTTLHEFNIDVAPAACRGVEPVPALEPPEGPGRPPPNHCRTQVNALTSPDSLTQARALLELAAPWVKVRLGCSVPNDTLLRLVQHGAPEVRSTAAMLLLWMNHPPDMRRTPKWGATVIAPEAR